MHYCHLSGNFGGILVPVSWEYCNWSKLLKAHACEDVFLWNRGRSSDYGKETSSANMKRGIWGVPEGLFSGLCAIPHA